jgi:RNA-directed DNA polymerase
MYYIIDADIQDYFGSIDHGILRNFLDRRVKDGVIRKMIDKWLKAGVLEDNELNYQKEGTPQGGIISPLLSNIYLHYVLDVWFSEVVQPLLSGKSFIVRYADDCVPRTRTVAILFSGAAHKMRDGPSEPVYRHRLQTTLCCIN